MNRSGTANSYKCPQCGSRAKIVTTKVITTQTREKYYQCTNLHCSSTFVTYETVDRWIIKTKSN
ncbi:MULTISPECIES: ogr/Delta-like zinc finger family protein [Wohlfahrtiimonas]|uniref:ogr/Delta-like zinc finger family protein n=1 Tax=Wohlfahrtiimonas TaxID=582472 RepID=UPI00036FB729|nr:ogr/Delta-like zinc finger family protein [Wohlfahrtiimonas chitiniclastica]MBS7819028.1 ogr/Delta-like zinc finger family protein [Wohlfahrtiimonas chitiniclastica]MBS7822136.1 ogr/Delta-like zinc finger family protein [Wohlfahrtiimonas chitiniclastica]MBS7825539.1 ogr/Delta-like zinc finger family protein [Wohlfahrtiimonas chitiniclastica]MBS7829928.1 ogr/Delta-like zinc finger family protein [Wohlfahrtiimonas chitiniclastica]